MLAILIYFCNFRTIRFYYYPNFLCGVFKSYYHIFVVWLQVYTLYMPILIFCLNKTTKNGTDYIVPFMNLFSLKYTLLLFFFFAVVVVSFSTQLFFHQNILHASLLPRQQCKNLLLSVNLKMQHKCRFIEIIYIITFYVQIHKNNL